MINSCSPNLLTLLPVALQSTSDYAFICLGLLLVLNILYSLTPLFRNPDDLSDIPLTPSQRSLLGLQPLRKNPLPSTPEEKRVYEDNFVTPPRYPRSSTPQSSPQSRPNSQQSARSASNSKTNSPLSLESRQGSPFLGARQGSDSPFSPSALRRNDIGGNSDSSRRHSYGSPSPLGFGTSTGSLFGAPRTPSPSALAAGGRGPSVGLNSRWLYEKGRGSPGRGSVYS